MMMMKEEMMLEETQRIYIKGTTEARIKIMRISRSVSYSRGGYRCLVSSSQTLNNPSSV
jgi:hypothetical protein